jgi:hypothetical protein
MTATSTLNGKPRRKQLSDQLDRLDSLVDALVAGLPEAVAAACKEGAREAVKDAIVEIFTNPDLRALISTVRQEPIPTIPILAPEPPLPPAQPKPSLWDRLKARIAAARDAVCNAATNVKNAVVGRFNTVRQTVAAISMAGGENLPVRRILLTALGVGLVVGIACLVLPQEVAACMSAVSAASTTIAVQIGSWLKNAARRFGLVT